ncbi:MAG: hypothetical protein GF421_12315 [Candidatus Aminicenantes bacterium]|nr:hypothetical protein [Candidatus Aminicenantes bacterium]
MKRFLKTTVFLLTIAIFFPVYAFQNPDLTTLINEKQVILGMKFLLSGISD